MTRPGVAPVSVAPSAPRRDEGGEGGGRFLRPLWDRRCDFPPFFSPNDDDERRLAKDADNRR
jgi:hypothetical protein